MQTFLLLRRRGPTWGQSGTVRLTWATTRQLHPASTAIPLRLEGPRRLGALRLGPLQLEALGLEPLGLLEPLRLGALRLQRFAMRLNHNIVCHTSRGAEGLLGKKHSSTVGVAQ